MADNQWHSLRELLPKIAAYVRPEMAARRVMHGNPNTTADYGQIVFSGTSQLVTAALRSIGCQWKGEGLDRQYRLIGATTAALIEEFIDQCCVSDATGAVSSRALRSAFERWCRRRGYEQVYWNNLEVSVYLKSLGYQWTRNNKKAVYPCGFLGIVLGNQSNGGECDASKDQGHNHLTPATRGLGRLVGISGEH